MQSVYEPQVLAVNDNCSRAARAPRDALSGLVVVAEAATSSRQAASRTRFQRSAPLGPEASLRSRKVRCASASPRTFDLRQSVADGSH